ncbi:hypothetical protein JL721_1427 [Aureococcus anophagefferens]|nr:hypothetical protein JL721_1427 [Aureococcus anophagefferens]
MENSLDHASLPDPSEPYEYETAYQRVFRPDKRLPDDAELKRFAALDAVARYPAGERAEIVLRALSALVANPAGPLDAAAVAAVADREPPPRSTGADGGESRATHEAWAADLLAAARGASDRKETVRYVARRAGRKIGDVLRWYYGSHKHDAPAYAALKAARYTTWVAEQSGDAASGEPARRPSLALSPAAPRPGRQAPGPRAKAKKARTRRRPCWTSRATATRRRPRSSCPRAPRTRRRPAGAAAPPPPGAAAAVAPASRLLAFRGRSCRTAGRRARAGAGRAAAGALPPSPGSARRLRRPRSRRRRPRRRRRGAAAGAARARRGPAALGPRRAAPGRWRRGGRRRPSAGADDVWGLQQTVAREARPDFDAAFARDLAALRAAARITSEGVAHGWGMVARRALEPGDVLADPTSVFRADDPPVSQMLGALSESYVKLPRGGGYFKIHKFVDDAARTGAAAWTFYTNEARAPDVANVEWQPTRSGGRTVLGWRVLRPVAAGDELLAHAGDEFAASRGARGRRDAAAAPAAQRRHADDDGGDDDAASDRPAASLRARRGRARRRRAAVVPRVRGAGAAGLRLRRGRRAAEVADWTATDEAALRRAAGAGAFDAGGRLKAGVVYRVSRAPALRPFLPPPAFLDDASAAQLAPGYARADPAHGALAWYMTVNNDTLLTVAARFGARASAAEIYAANRHRLDGLQHPQKKSGKPTNFKPETTLLVPLEGPPAAAPPRPYDCAACRGRNVKHACAGVFAGDPARWPAPRKPCAACRLAGRLGPRACALAGHGDAPAYDSRPASRRAPRGCVRVPREPDDEPPPADDDASDENEWRDADAPPPPPDDASEENTEWRGWRDDGHAFLGRAIGARFEAGGAAPGRVVRFHRGVLAGEEEDLERPRSSSPPGPRRRAGADDDGSVAGVDGSVGDDDGGAGDDDGGAGEPEDRRIRVGATVAKKFAGYGSEPWRGRIADVDVAARRCVVEWSDESETRESFKELTRCFDRAEGKPAAKAPKAKAAAPAPKRAAPPPPPPCDECRFCLDKPRNGGPGRMNQACVVVAKYREDHGLKKTKKSRKPGSH